MTNTQMVMLDDRIGTALARFSTSAAVAAGNDLNDLGHSGQGSPPGGTRPHAIVSNLQAALDYEEHTRQHSRGTGSDGGLPPPPRPRGRSRRFDLKREPVSMSLPSSPLIGPGPGEGRSAGLNLYRTHAPRLSLLLGDNPPPLVVSGRRAGSDAGSGEHELSSEAYTDGSASEVYPGSPSVKQGSRRGLSSLQRVEHMLGKSKHALGTVVAGGRRMSEADQSGRDALMRPSARDRARQGAAINFFSAPSPILATPLVPTSRTAAPAVLANPTIPRQTRVGSPPARSHARQGSNMSQQPRSPSLASSSTHLPPDTPSEPCISVSSTIYPASRRSFSSHHSPGGRLPEMDHDRESFIDLTSPTFPPHADQNSTPEHGVTPGSRVLASQDSNKLNTSPRRPPLPLITTTTPSTKPPRPTTPKPDFGRRSASAQPRHRRSGSNHARSPGGVDEAPADMPRGLRNIPSTTNLLHPQERADRIRKTRKLTQLFGQTPGVAPEPIDVELANGCLPIAPALGKRKHKPAASMLDDAIVPAMWPPGDHGQQLYLGVRRRSVPLSPQDFSSISGHSILTISQTPPHVIEIGSQEGVPQSDWVGHGRAHEALPSGSPTSFIDLSDDEGALDGFSEILPAERPKVHRRPPQPFSPSTPLPDNLSPEQQAEEERRRKREKLAKLHRFLGSRVPAHLVLGSLEEGVPLPSPVVSPLDNMHEEDGDTRKARTRRRRSSSVAEFAGTWSDEIDRLKEDLNDHEKAINVRRAVKMEKMFGVAPPQVLYHTRQAAPTPSSSAVPVPAKNWQTPRSPTLPPSSPTSPGGRNLNQSAYKGKSKKGSRPGTAESTQPLLPPNHGADDWSLAPAPAMSDVYLHYRHSLNSLNDIIDRDDKQSLAELHDYLSGNLQDVPEQSSADDTASVITTSTKPERRRSLPSRTSMGSVSSDFSLLASPPAEETTFQVRRKRAAKLTHFFGVNYRDLMGEILDSIEKGLEEERGKGTLKPDEVQDLLQKLVKLKTKRNNLS